MELLGGLAVKEWKNILNWFCNLISHFPNKTGASEKHINIFVTLKPLENPLFYKSNVYDNFSTYLYVKLQGYKSFCKPSIAFVFLSGSKQYAVSVNKTDKCLLFKCAYPFTIKRSRRSRRCKCQQIFRYWYLITTEWLQWGLTFTGALIYRPSERLASEIAMTFALETKLNN